MSKLGKLAAHLNDIDKLLKHTNLLLERNPYPNRDLDLNGLRHTNYVNTWRYLIRELSYDFLLTDNSLLLFNQEKEEVSFSFYGCPFDCVDYNVFLNSQGFEFGEVGDQFIQEYNEYLSQCTVKDSPINFRFDYSPKQYFEGLHPASHMHFGFDNSVRVGINTILDPITFVFFILRQNYTDNYHQLLDDKKYIPVIGGLKPKLEKVPKKFFLQKDMDEFYLS